MLIKNLFISYITSQLIEGIQSLMLKWNLNYRRNKIDKQSIWSVVHKYTASDEKRMIICVKGTKIFRHNENWFLKRKSAKIRHSKNIENMRNCIKLPMQKMFM